MCNEMCNRMVAFLKHKETRTSDGYYSRYTKHEDKSHLSPFPRSTAIFKTNHGYYIFPVPTFFKYHIFSTLKLLRVLQTSASVTG